MLSLKKYLTSTDEPDPLLRALSLILDGISQHMVEFDPEDKRAFQNSISRLQVDLVEGRQSDQAMAFTAGAIVQTFEAYNAGVRRQFLARCNELRDMVELATEALRATCNANRRTVYSLGQIEIELRNASQIEDLRTLRGKLETCLASVRSEVAQHVAEGGAAHAALHAVSAPRPPAPPVAHLGAELSLGLPGREESRECLENARLSHSAVWAVALNLNRLATVNSRFGSKACETYMLMASQSIAQKLSDCDQLFQWGGQGFLAVMVRSGTLENVRNEIVQMSAAQRPFTFTVGDRKILIPLSISFLCLPAWMEPDADTLIGKIDEFVLKGTAA